MNRYVLLSLCIASAGGTASANEIEEIQRAWTQRQEETSSVRLEWTEHQTRTQPQPIAHTSKPDKPEQLQPEETVVDFTKAVTISGARFRIFESGALFDHRTERVDPFEQTIVFDGTGKSFRNYTTQESNFGKFANTSPELADATSRPVMYALNPAGTNFGQIDLDEYEISSDTEIVAGRHCIVLDRRVTKPVESRLFIDSERGALILRVVGLEGEAIARQVDISYDRDTAGHWYPSAWQFVIMDGSADKFAFIAEAKTTDVQFMYHARPEEFDIAYPRGTVIYDNRVSPMRTLVVGKDNELRPSEPVPREKPGDGAKGNTGMIGRWWLVVVNVGVLIVITALLVFRKFRRC